MNEWSVWIQSRFHDLKFIWIYFLDIIIISCSKLSSKIVFPSFPTCILEEVVRSYNVTNTFASLKKLFLLRCLLCLVCSFGARATKVCACFLLGLLSNLILYLLAKKFTNKELGLYLVIMVWFPIALLIKGDQFVSLSRIASLLLSIGVTPGCVVVSGHGQLLRPTTWFSCSGKVILAKVYLLKWLGCSLCCRLGRKL